MARYRVLILFAAMLSSCVTGAATVAAPTALENQLLGAYQALDKDLVRVSSVRGPLMSSSYDVVRGEALAQRGIQRFNEDDVLSLKEAGCIAETLRAAVVARSCKFARQDAVNRRILKRVVEEENRARHAIMTWAVWDMARQSGTQVGPIHFDNVRRAYAKLLRDTLTAGHIYEARPGIFEKK